MLDGAGFEVERGAYDLPTAVRGPGGLGTTVDRHLRRVRRAARRWATPAATTSSRRRHWGRGWRWPVSPTTSASPSPCSARPAEEGGGGKVLLLERGAFDGAHAAMMVHPWPEDRLAATCLAVDHIEVHYTGRAAHASASPEQGVNAADAIVVAQVGIGLIRQHLRRGDQVHGIVTKGGDAPNIVPEETRGRFMVRAPYARGPRRAAAPHRALLRSRRARHGVLARDPRPGSRPTRTWSPTTPFSPPGGTTPRSSAGATPADERPEARPTISTDMANISLAVPSIHPMIGIETHGAVNHQAEFAAACLGPSAEQAVFDGAARHGVDGHRRRHRRGIARPPGVTRRLRLGPVPPG